MSCQYPIPDSETSCSYVYIDKCKLIDTACSLATLQFIFFFCQKVSLGVNSTSSNSQMHNSLHILQLLSTVGAINVLSIDDKALVGQGEGALLAVEAVLMPGQSLIVDHIGAVAKPCTETHEGVFFNTKKRMLT